MEYIEKAKYELIMALKNEESKDIVDVSREYYKDMVNIVSANKDNFKNNIKYILSFNAGTVEDTYERDSFVFTNEAKMLEFYEKYKEKNKVKCITVLEVHDIDPENNFRPNTEIHIDTWLHNKIKK